MRFPRRWISLSLAFTTLTLTCVLADAASKTIKPDEKLVFFSSVAKLNTDGTKWIIPVRGRIYEPEVQSPVRKKIRDLIRSAAEVPKDAPENEILQQRLRYFVVDNEGGKPISVKIGQKSYPVADSDGDGIFGGTIEVPREETAEHTKKGVLAYAYEQRNLTVAGDTILVPPQGLSVISDIDDTIKITNVRDSKETLANTFLRKFRETPGLSKFYRDIAESRPDARFHFVSGSPWQLYEPLKELFQEAGFPDASYHLKEVALDGTSLSNLFIDPMEFKVPAITELFENYPARKFLLVGDSGEKDPEVYAEIFRKFPDRVEGIFIRDVTDEPATAARYEKVFAGIDKGKWRLFKHPEEIQENVRVILGKSPDADCANCTHPQRSPANPVSPLMDVIENISR